MNIKDYAHYYIGQPCFNTWFTPDHDAYDAGWKLTGIQSTSVRPFGLENETDKTWTESIMPVLRQLEDMTEEEKGQIWELIFNRPFPSSGNVLWFDKEERTTSKRWVMMSGVERVGIEMNGNVWADSDLSHHKFNPNIITHYLLSRGFDLFGLIDAGLAIDLKTTIQ